MSWVECIICACWRSGWQMTFLHRFVQLLKEEKYLCVHDAHYVRSRGYHVSVFFFSFCLSFYCAVFFIFVTLRPLHHHWCVGILPLLVVAAEFRTDTPSDMRYACACFASFAVFHRSKSTVLTEQTVDFTKWRVLRALFTWYLYGFQQQRR